MKKLNSVVSYTCIETIFGETDTYDVNNIAISPQGWSTETKCDKCNKQTKYITTSGCLRVSDGKFLEKIS